MYCTVYFYCTVDVIVVDIGAADVQASSSAVVEIMQAKRSPSVILLQVIPALFTAYCRMIYIKQRKLLSGDLNQRR